MSEEENKEPVAENTEEQAADVEKVAAEVENESVENDTVNPIASQAARFAYIEKLGKSLDEYNATDDDMDIISSCKSQVLVELVYVIDFASKLPEDSPLKKAAEVLEKHLYNCYEKTDRIQANARRKNIESRYHKDISQEMYEEQPKFNRQQGIITDESILPECNVINLKGLGLTGGGIALLTQLIGSPQETLKAQMPDLVEELNGKVTEEEQMSAGKFITQLLTNLAGLKSEKSMLDALEGKSSIANVMALVGGHGL